MLTFTNLEVMPVRVYGWKFSRNYKKATEKQFLLAALDAPKLSQTEFYALKTNLLKSCMHDQTHAALE